MTGPEHFREAEKHIELASYVAADSPHGEAVHLQYAQVHATLALVAATAGVPIAVEYGNEDAPVLAEWAAAIERPTYVEEEST
jgi:hypothetical protein